MIFIERQEEPQFLSKANNKWDKETNRAIAHYTAVPQNNGQFTYKHYRDAQIKEALMKNFPKCVYCESSYAGVSDGDIEHFRPKGQVFGKVPPNPGYYWLANAWNNLFMSCMHCNQVRKHKIYNEELVRTQGKLDQFPLIGNNANRVIDDINDVAAEEPFRLLLNPCIDNPEDHLEYSEDALIKSGTDKGNKSIEVYALQRQFLVVERQKQLDFIFTHIELTKDTLNLFNANQDQAHKHMLDKQLNALKKLTDEKEPYAGMARYFVRRFLRANNLI